MRQRAAAIGGMLRTALAVATQFPKIPLWLAMPSGSERAKRIEQSFFNGLVRHLGLAVRVTGSPLTGQSTILVSNHISWADIIIYAALLDARFVAKDDISDWPVLGRLARRYGPIFVARGKRANSGAQNDSIREALRSGEAVLLFAEGTTSDGTSILPFKSSLFESADAATAVQPVVIRYLTPAGLPLDPLAQRAIAWIDDDDLLAGVLRVATQPVLAHIEFLEPLDPRSFGSRKQLAETVRDRILYAYHGLSAAMHG